MAAIALAMACGYHVAVSANSVAGVRTHRTNRPKPTASKGEQWGWAGRTWEARYSPAPSHM